MKDIYVFDFDGTLTYDDSMLKFIAFAKGKIRLFLSLLLFAPLLVLMKLKLVNNGYVKQRFLSLHFKGMPIDKFNHLCQAFVSTNRHLLRPNASLFIEDVINKGHEVVILTASAENWVAPFFYNKPISIIGTQLDVVDGRLTGKLASPNCYGPQKLIRFNKQFHPETYNKLFVFGDSRGDKEMFDIADKSYYKYFSTPNH